MDSRRDQHGSYYPRNPVDCTDDEIALLAATVLGGTAVEWLQHIQALDNLLVLFGLERQKNIYHGGFLIFHPKDPGRARWLAAKALEEEWLESVKLLAR